ncbi:MAG: hypothetical protein JXA67_08290 [Micromonosporaceae bacterium]|nr:hypothetical protein [Micromonosporaceae bacterium]
MRRPLMYFLAWATAATVIVTVSWWGISSAVDAAVSTRVSPLSPVDLRDVVPSSPAPSPSPSPSASPSLSTAPSPSPTTTSPKPSAQPSETWIAQSDGHGGTGYKRTFHTAGGDAVVWSSRGDARILEATPKAGWDCSVREDGQDAAMVTFFVPGQRSRTAYVSVGWLNGPVAEFGESVGLPG